MTESVARRLAAEGCGSILLTATVVGSGIMGERLANGNAAIALLANTGATVAVLAVLITLLAPISGAHFNPAVTFALALRKQVAWRTASAYAGVQIAGCCLGAVLAHAMFDLPLLQTSTHVRSGPSQVLSELVATFGLLFVILGCKRARNAPWLVASWIGAAYWFTASTSFANPAITIARCLTNTFAGIRPADVPAFVGAQLLGALVGLCVGYALFSPRTARGGVEAVLPPAPKALRADEAHGAT
jgi:glycerol uptake facilitator-like aquaporin